MREWTVLPNFRSPHRPTEMLREKGISYSEVIRLEDVMPELDLLYMTRVQKERFFNEEDYIRLKDFYILDTATPSPALITGIPDFSAATMGAPSLGWRMAQMSA